MKHMLRGLLIFIVFWLTSYFSFMDESIIARGGAQTRDVPVADVLKGRPKGKNSKAQGNNRYQVKKMTGRNAALHQFPVGSPPQSRTYITMGITLWRVRLATETETQTSQTIIEKMIWDNRERDVVITRISDESLITDNDLIQMSIEYLPHGDGARVSPSNQVGYLYVVNQEQFSDGSLGKARMIFPTLQTYKGDNRVLGGKIVTLPEPRRPFRIERSTSGQSQAYEVYTIILSPKPLNIELSQPLTRRAMDLPRDLVAIWQRSWGVGAVRADLRDGLGQMRTTRELGANGNTNDERDTKDTDEDLTQDDSPPQIVFRKIVRFGEAMAVTVKLPFKEKSPTTNGR
jgi:hypothetical protein